MDTPVVNCKTDPVGRNITISNAFDKRDIAPQLIRITFESLYNPDNHINTKTFKILTFTHDGYGIDYIDSGITINFYCVTPCKTCNLDEPTQCYSCYTSGLSAAPFLHEDTCISSCPD